ncbi:MAG: hypothetical protein EA362_05905, partial [Saprospirales bacterium]
MPVAVIDLGTNTFHLLIAELNDNSFKEIYRERKFIKLGEHSSDFIGPQAFQRGLDAIKEFCEVCKNYKVNEIYAIGTAMLRNAINSRSFLEAVSISMGIQIQVINGLEEARLIFKGVQTAGLLSDKKDLLMDIGGGSVEFIFCDNKNAEWFESIDIGVSILKHRFPVKNIFSPKDILKLENYLDYKLEPIYDKAYGMEHLNLIGISGTFDVIRDHFLREKKITEYSEFILLPEEVKAFCEEIIPLSIEAKIKHPSIPDSRADLISYA